MKRLALILCLAAVSPLQAGLKDERELLKNDPAKAATNLAERLADHPSDPWLMYNAGVAAYAAGDYAKADALWQQLSTTEMPDPLRGQVWLQIGNVSYRIVQPQFEQRAICVASPRPPRAPGRAQARHAPAAGR